MSVRAGAATALARFGAEAEGAIPALEAARKQHEGAVRDAKADPAFAGLRGTSDFEGLFGPDGAGGK